MELSLDYGMDDPNLNNFSSPPNPSQPSLGLGMGLFPGSGNANAPSFDGRQRSATSGFLHLGPSLTMPDDVPPSSHYEVNLFESSAEPLFTRPPFDAQLGNNPPGLRESSRAPFSSASSINLNDPDPIDEFASMHSLSRRTQRSMSDVDPLNFNDSFDYGPSSGVGSMFSCGSFSTVFPPLGDSCK